MENVSVQDIVRATGGVLLSGNSDALLNKIRLDSRQVEAGDLFVPIIGEKVDAHRFLPQVAETAPALSSRVNRTRRQRRWKRLLAHGSLWMTRRKRSRQWDVISESA